MPSNSLVSKQTYVFDVWACVHSDHISMLNTKVVANNAVDASTSVIELVVGEDDENSVLALLSLDQDGVATEELQVLHGLVGERDNRVVIVDGISNPVVLLALHMRTLSSISLTSKSLASSSSSRWRLRYHLAEVAVSMLSHLSLPRRVAFATYFSVLLSGGVAMIC